MGKVVLLESYRNGPGQRVGLEASAPSSCISPIIDSSLPIDADRIRHASAEVIVFFQKLFETKKVHIALPQEEINEESMLRIFGEDNESWDISIGDFNDMMTEKPRNSSHEELRQYLVTIFGRAGIETFFELYSPRIIDKLPIEIDRDNLGDLLEIPIVIELAEGLSHFSIGMDLTSKGVTAYPAAFREPKGVSLFLLCVEYLIQTSNDREMQYSPDESVEILKYYKGVMVIIKVRYGLLEEIVMERIYVHNPQYRSMKNDRIALGVFYGKNVVPLRR